MPEFFACFLNSGHYLATYVYKFNIKLTVLKIFV